VPENRETTIAVRGSSVTVLSRRDENSISLTDIAKHKEPDRSDHVIQNWMRNRNTIEFIGVWERLNDPDFKPLEFDGIRSCRDAVDSPEVRMTTRIELDCDYL